ncbi:phage portal protein [Bacillus thuringiensis serovar kyushuensis]|uniref:phage portal protein n=1 Tax=Bacillus thuringiensis TaxID=1428 RepID=UPI000B42F235|nr:phage portal protein [Bacillus thuringiensis]MEC2865986.1 phage portal protein [Bacillus cereus]OTZ62638.1 phage portal protein [Bacillus thuringiensis serovar kyushuensis]OTZ62667.1 phage portal protein [Bacillus thuringiensis serovar kyushuensis]OTZ73916.1 phage portal protein [Bacillus thuringiensis serovar kyushuensis]OTZ74683.1 phage portal protein [Bacillus thuringiensis serovar kyushuensis]
MGVMNWLKGFWSGKTLKDLRSCDYELEVDYFYKKLAVESCIDLIANALTMCEIQTFDKGKEIRGENYYLLNVQPNQNQNASEFMHSLVHHLIDDNECLVIMSNDQLYIADEFTVEHYTFKESVYKNIVIGDLNLRREYMESEVLYFKLNDNNIMQVIDGMYESLGKLLISTINFYKRKNSKRFLLKGDFLRAQDEETQKKIDEFFDNQLKNWLDPNKETSTFQLPDGYNLEDLSDGGKGSASNGTSRDTTALINDIFNYVAIAFHVPVGILKGDVADIEKQMDSFLAFCINPMARLIQDEFNRKMYKKKDFLKRSYLKIDTTKIKVVDITKLATALDKLFAIGGLSINDILIILGREPIEEEWANKRFVTKNYQEADSLEGGEKDETLQK